MEVTSGQVAWRVANSLREQQARIIANWAVRVSTLPTFRAMPEIALEDLQGQIPDLLDAALAAFATADPGMEPGVMEHGESIASAHGRVSAEQGMSIGLLLSELQLLRFEVWGAMQRAIEALPTLESTPRDLDARLAAIFDPLVIATAEAWASVFERRGSTNLRSMDDVDRMRT